MSAPAVVDARGVPDLRLWLLDQWRPGRTLNRYAARALDHQSQLFRRPSNPTRFAEEEVRDLESATLWWVGAEMVELLMAAAAGVLDDVVQYDLPVPSPSGLVVFERPWYGLDSHGEAGTLAIPDERAPEGRIAVDAVSWGPRRWNPVDVVGDSVVGERLVEVEDALVAAVRRVHAPRTFGGDGYSWKVCVEDRQAWPCATEETLRDVTGGFPSDAEWEAWR